MSAIVATVERELLTGARRSTAMPAGTGSSRFIGGRSSRSKNCRAYGLKLSTNRRWPSAYSVSSARLLLPAPLTPVIATICPGSSATSTPLRLCVCAPSRIVFCIRERQRNAGGAAAQLTDRAFCRNVAEMRRAVVGVALALGCSDGSQLGKADDGAAASRYEPLVALDAFSAVGRSQDL